MLPDVMIDIETLGTASDAAVLSIGMLEFDPYSGVMGAEQYHVLEVDSQLQAGASVTMGTIQWWITEAAAVFPHLDQSVVLRTPGVATSMVSSFCKERSRIWAHGPHFDVAILNNLHRRMGGSNDCISHHWKVRDTRTLFEQAGVQPARVKGQHHNALQDCRAQAGAVIRAYGVLGRSPAAKMGVK